MQKNGFLMRFISCTLALVLLVGMIPMGALRVNAAEGEYEWKKISDPQTTYIALSETELKCGTSKSEMVEGVLLVTAQTPARALTATEDGQLTTVLLNDIVKTASGDVISAEDGNSITTWSVEYYSYNQSSTYLWIPQVYTNVGGTLYYLDIANSQSSVLLSTSKLGESQGTVETGGAVILSANNNLSKSLSVDASGGVLCGSAQTPIFFYKLKGQADAVYAKISYPTVATVQGVQSMAMDQFLAAVSEYCEILFSNDGGATVAKSLPLNESGIGYHIFGPKGSNITEVTDNPAIVEEGEYVIEIDTPNGEELGEITVNVKLADKPTVDLDIETNSVLVYKDEGSKDIQLTPKITAGFPLPEYTYRVTSNNEAVATASVNDDVLTVQAVSKGTATVTVELVPGNDTVLAGSVEKTVTVQVESRPFELTVKPTGLVMQKETQKALSDMVTAAVTVNGTPVVAGSYNLTWTIPESDAAVATLTDGTVNAIGKGTATLTATLTYILDGETKTEEKTVTIVVTESKPEEGDWKKVYAGDYEYSRLTYDQLDSNLGEEILMVYGQTPPDANGVCSGVVITTEDGSSFLQIPVTIQLTGDNKYEITPTGSGTLSHWTMGSGLVFSRTINATDYKINSDNGSITLNQWTYTSYIAKSGSAEGSIWLERQWSNGDYIGYNEGGLVQTSSPDQSADAYIYKPTLIAGTAINAKLYAADTYSFDVTEYYDGLLQDVLGQTQIWVDTNDDRVADETYFLNETLPEGYSWELYKGSEKVDQITSTGKYTVQVSYTDRSDNTKKTMGSFIVEIKAPKKVDLAITTDGTLDADGNLSLGTGKTANITTVLTVTMEDGSIVPTGLVESDITVTVGNEYYIGYENGIVKGNNQGEADLKATLGSSLKINGLEVLNDVTEKNTTATLKVKVFPIYYVDLDISKIPGSVTIDVADEGKTSAEITLGYLKSDQNQTLPEGASVSYECEISDPDNTGIQAAVKQSDGTYKLVISNAKAKGSATVTVKLVFSEDSDAWETGTVTQKTFTVNVTYNAAEPYELAVSPSNVLIGVGLSKTLQAAVTQNGNAVADPVITWSCDNEDIASVDENGVVTGKTVGSTTVTATVTYKLPNEDQYRTESVQIPVKVAAGADLYEMIVIPEATTINIGGKLSPNVVVKYQGEVITPESLNWSTNDSNVATVENGAITAKGCGSATVTVTYTSADGIQLSKTISLTVTEPVLELGVGKTDDTYYIPVGASMPLVPHVDMLDEFGSYDIAWEVIGPDGVISVAETTYGGLRAVGEAGIAGVQSITNAVQQIKALKEGEVTLRACLTKVDGEDVQGIPDVVKIIVVPVSATEEVVSTDFYNRNNRLHIPAEDQDNPYEFRIIDQHTFLPDSYGMDARIIAQAGDTRVDFSQVKVAVYKNGQLLLDDQGNPFIIPTSELSFYDVSTEKVGWVKVRVTYKDYYKGTISLFEDGATGEVEAHLYDEYTTGEGNTDGYVWMYVCPKKTYTLSAIADINGTPVTVTMTIDELRHWLGEGWGYAAENWANATPFYREGHGNDVRFTGDRNPTIRISYTYKGKDYVYSNYAELGPDGAIWGDCPVKWTALTTGAITGANQPYTTDQFKAQTDVATSDAEAYGEITFQLNSVKDPEGYNQIAFREPVTFTMPVTIRDNTVYEDTPITFGYTPSWGGQATAYKSFLGGIPITAYAISYVADLSTDHFQIGITDGVPTQMIGGQWYEWFSLDVPLGTTAVETTFHTVTRSDGVVFIFNPEEKAAEANYTISLDPQMLILSSKEKPVKDVPNTGTLVATVRDEYGNLIGENVPVKVKWTIRNAEIAATDVVRDASGKIVTTGKDQSTEENFTGPTRPDVGVTGGITGVTYLTVQLMEVNNKDVSKWGIADYSIIYVIEEDYKSQMDVVIDYDKPIDIDIHDFVDKETGYNFIGFSDLEHSLRQHAYTAYGEIEIVDGNQAYYTPGMFVEGVDDVYVIFQHVDQDGKYLWHHYLINVIPATVMYYETDGTVADEFTCNGDWTNAGSDVSVSAEGGSYEDVQDDYRSEERDGKEIYGYDSSYDYDAHLSNQSSMFVKGTTTAAEIVDNDPSTSASFSFTGTGFDIIARTDMKQATLRVHVTKQGEDKPTKIVSVICKGENKLYQIPVISVKGLDYGTYDVEIIVYASYDASGSGLPADLIDQLSRGNEFYFDAIRIYDPVKGNAIAEAAYKSDGEYAQTITQIGKLLIDQQTFEKTAIGEQQVSGAVFMDSYTLGEGDFITATDVATYDEVGPNNEVYLGKGQGIAFILNTKETMPASIQIGAKSITGDPVTLNAKLVSAGTTGAAASTITYQPRTIQTSTAMYYELAEGQDLTDFFADDKDVYVVIWNTGETVLSVTDIKFAYDTNVPGTVQLEYSAELAKVAAELISGEKQDTYLQKIDGEWCYCDQDGLMIVTTGLVKTTDGSMWYVENGKVDFDFSGLYEQYAIRGGRVETELNGIAQRGDGWWYFTNGMVDTTFTGKAEYNGTEYDVSNGVVQMKSSTES